MTYILPPSSNALMVMTVAPSHTMTKTAENKSAPWSDSSPLDEPTVLSARRDNTLPTNKERRGSVEVVMAGTAAREDHEDVQRQGEAVQQRAPQIPVSRDRRALGLRDEGNDDVEGLEQDGAHVAPLHESSEQMSTREAICICMQGRSVRWWCRWAHRVSWVRMARPL